MPGGEKLSMIRMDIRWVPLAISFLSRSGVHYTQVCKTIPTRTYLQYLCVRGMGSQNITGGAGTRNRGVAQEIDKEQSEDERICCSITTVED